MGRPINKRYFGILGGDGATVFTATGPNLPIRFKFTNGTVYEGYIVKQKSARRFVCSDGTRTLLCTLVDGTANNFDPPNNRECVITGFQANSQVQRSIRRLTNRTAWDYQGNLHIWSLQDDSSQTILILNRP